jgi:hypothetical protein
MSGPLQARARMRCAVKTGGMYSTLHGKRHVRRWHKDRCVCLCGV